MTQIQKTKKEKREEAKQRAAVYDAEITKIRILLEPIFGKYVSISYVQETDKLPGSIEVRIRDQQEVTFDNLTEISKIFSTKKININPYSEDHGGCESCSWTESGTSIWILDYKLP